MSESKYRNDRLTFEREAPYRLHVLVRMARPLAPNRIHFMRIKNDEIDSSIEKTVINPVTAKLNN